MPSSGLGPLPLLLLQAAVILAATRACAVLARRLGQPTVIGEVIGGILLGPSALGLLWPEAGAFLFPAGSLAWLNALGRGGLLLFMFEVGLELDFRAVKEQSRTVLRVSYASIAAPFLLGLLAARVVYRDWAPTGVPFLSFGLFMGVAMSITAFPMLARILRERKLVATPLGSMALACAAVDDFTAWCALALISGFAHGGSWAESLGALGILGAFLAGSALSKRLASRRALTNALELVSALLLPLFFALSGLRTRMGLLVEPGAWPACLLLIVVAVAGKLGGGALAARWSGRPWREALGLGALMNARGLVELVTLNIGYDLGLISPALFAMMVLMALATTLMTGPLLELFVPELRRRQEQIEKG